QLAISSDVEGIGARQLAPSLARLERFSFTSCELLTTDIDKSAVLRYLGPNCSHLWFKWAYYMIMDVVDIPNIVRKVLLAKPDLLVRLTHLNLECKKTSKLWIYCAKMQPPCRCWGFVFPG